MTELEMKKLLRSKGMCGRVAEGHACILSRHHDDDAHERDWTVRRDLAAPTSARLYRVQETAPPPGRPCRIFTTDDEDHAEWLASTLASLRPSEDDAAEARPMVGDVFLVLPGHLHYSLRVGRITVTRLGHLPGDAAEDDPFVLTRLAPSSSEEPGVRGAIFRWSEIRRIGRLVDDHPSDRAKDQLAMALGQEDLAWLLKHGFEVT